jgi:hypothetical protein
MSDTVYRGEAGMADRTGLGVLGLLFGSVTAVVLLITAVVVTGHVEGRLRLDNGQAAAAASVGEFAIGR